MKLITIPLSFIYRIIVFIRNRLYNNGILSQKELDCIVISVGNLSYGGTGKTTFVEHIAEYLLEKEKFVAIILKGYKREVDDIKVIEVGYENAKGDLNTESIGDEAFLFLENIKTSKGRGLIIVGEDKTKTAKFAYAKFKPEVMIIDDGFQHRKLARDLDILLIDGNEGRYLIPAGRLREPFKNRSRADLVILNEKFYGPRMLERMGNTPYSVCKYELENFMNVNKQPADISGKKVLAFCGIGDPGSFKVFLSSKNMDILKFIEFPDHHNFTLNDVNRLISEFETCGAEAIITTQKDFVRLINSEFVMESRSDNKYRELIYKQPLYYTVIKTTFRKNGEELYSHLDKVAKLV